METYNADTSTLVDVGQVAPVLIHTEGGPKDARSKEHCGQKSGGGPAHLVELLSSGCWSLSVVFCR